MKRARTTTGTGRADLLDAGFVVLLGGIAASAFRESFGGYEFMTAAVVAVVLGTAIGYLTNLRGLSALPTAALGVVGYVLVVGTVGFREAATAAMFPSLDTAQNSLETVVTGWKNLLTISPPIGPASGLMVLPAFCAFVVGICSYRAARSRRSSWWVLLPVFVTLSLGLLCGFPEPVSVLFHGVMVALTAFVWIALREHRRRPVVNHTRNTARLVRAAGLLAVAGTLGLALGPALPLVDANSRVAWRSEVRPPFDPSLYPSPLNGYRRYLKDLKDDTLFTIAGVPDGVPIRLATMDTYDGLVWRVSGGTTGTSGLFERVGEKVDPDFTGSPATIEVMIGEGYPSDSVWMPTVGEVKSIEFGGLRADELAQSFRYNRSTDVAATPLMLRAGDSYTLEVTLPHLESELASGSWSVIPQVPNDVLAIDSVNAFASGALLRPMAQQSGEVAKARALAAALRTGYYHDPDAEIDKLPSGHGAARLDRFVEMDKPIGDAEQYAATAGLIASVYQVPARVVVGFMQPTDAPGGASVAITGDDAEAWIEIPVEGLGWIALAATPDRSQVPEELDQQETKLPERQTQVPAPKTNVVPDVPVDASAATPERREQSDDERTGIARITSNLWLMLAIAAVVSPTVVLGGTGGLIAHMKRRRRRKRWAASSPSQRIAGAWSEFADVMVDFGRPIPVFASRREIAALCGGSAVGLATRADLSVFGPGEPTDTEVDAFWADVDHVLDELIGPTSRIERWKANVNLTSLIVGRHR